MTINYDQSKVYKIWSPSGDKIYVGSTTKQYLSQRMTAHRNSYNCWKTGKYHFITSYSIFDEYGLDKCFIELLEAKACNSKDELKQFEGGYIRNLVCVNKNIPDRTKEEYHKNNKDKIKMYQEEYQETNKDKMKEYRETNKDKIKEYREANKDKMKVYKEEYYQANRDKINARRRELRKEKKLSSITN